jgi:mannose-6-phosphate isomerase-like protein (cupin superfamily)
MSRFATRALPAEPDDVAPDGSDVRVLARLGGGSMAHFELAAGKVSAAMTHRTVEEIWYVLAGSGEMWRCQHGHEEFVALQPGLCVTIPVGTHFQFRASPTETLSVVAVTMPPWPDAEEAVSVAGPWTR